MLVSAICPTFNRRNLIKVAIASFLAQDWPEKEMVIVDDGQISIADLIEDVPGVRYVRPATRHTIGTKRNVACDAAQGEVIVHFDDDDWSAPIRIKDQVNRLLQSGKQVTGYHTMLFWNGQRAYRYIGDQWYATGTSLCYFKAFWKRHPFPDIDRAEDNALVFEARDQHAIESVDAGKLIVGRVHGANTFPYSALGKSEQWPEVPKSEIPQAFFEAIAA